ncbi:MAG: ferritin-like domain-containing protein [Duganella sp.]
MPTPTPAPSPAPTPAPAPAPAVVWTQEQLYAHLQMAIDVEFFTIPLYLTAAASVLPADRATLNVTVSGENQQSAAQSAAFPVYDTIMSVAIEEMYHLMWICNVAVSVGMPIKITAPDMSTLPSALGLPDSLIKAYTGPGNLADVIDLLVAIETPDSNYSYQPTPTDAITNFSGPVEPLDSYDSIGDLYHALAYGLQELFPTLNQASYAAFQKQMISGTYPQVGFVTSLSTAMNCIAAIVEQGEGTGVNGYIPGAYDPSEGSYVAENGYTHYQRFLAVQQNIEQIKSSLYPTPAGGDPTNASQHSLTSNYSSLLQAINTSYATPSNILNTSGMGSLGGDIDDLWGAGLLPLWTYTTPPVQPVPLELHVCQGLNTCAGHGVNGSGTMPGDGDCATIEHTCQESNSCHGQGGCGYPGQLRAKGPAIAFTPGENLCQGMGGCASPISVWQVFNSGPLQGKYVWCEARKLFEARMALQGMTTQQPNPQPSAARLAKSTSSGDQPLANNTSCPS